MQHLDKTLDKNYQKYVNSNDRKRSKGVLRLLLNSVSPSYQKHGQLMAVNGFTGPMPRTIPNQRQRRKLAAQMR